MERIKKFFSSLTQRKAEKSYRRAFVATIPFFIGFACLWSVAGLIGVIDLFANETAYGIAESNWQTKMERKLWKQQFWAAIDNPEYQSDIDESALEAAMVARSIFIDSDPLTVEEWSVARSYHTTMSGQCGITRSGYGFTDKFSEKLVLYQEEGLASVFPTLPEMPVYTDPQFHQSSWIMSYQVIPWVFGSWFAFSVILSLCAFPLEEQSEKFYMKELRKYPFANSREIREHQEKICTQRGDDRFFWKALYMAELAPVYAPLIAWSLAKEYVPGYWNRGQRWYQLNKKHPHKEEIRKTRVILAELRKNEADQESIERAERLLEKWIREGEVEAGSMDDIRRRRIESAQVALELQETTFACARDALGELDGYRSGDSSQSDGSDSDLDKKRKAGQRSSTQQQC